MPLPRDAFKARLLLALKSVLGPATDPLLSWVNPRSTLGGGGFSEASKKDAHP